MSPIGLAAGAAAGVIADRLLGDPSDALHPVAWFGRIMGGIERRCYADSRAVGMGYTAVGVVLGAAAGGSLTVAARPLPLLLRRSVPVAVATGLAVAGRMLGSVAGDIAVPLAAGDLSTARALLPSLVGRDPAQLDASAISRAVIESVAENTVDAVVAPVLWAVAFGAPGALAYRAVNTMDAMVGYRNTRYARFGWASARLDDVANWIPARITALLVMTVRPGSARRVVQVVRRDSPAHPSPNSGVAEGAFAAAIGVQLGGVNRYGDTTEDRGTLGDGRTPDAAGIDAAVTLLRDVSAALVAMCLGVGLTVALLRGAKVRGR